MESNSSKCIFTF